jgi:hypothetical protein
LINIGLRYDRLSKQARDGDCYIGSFGASFCTPFPIGELAAEQANVAAVTEGLSMGDLGSIKA